MNDVDGGAEEPGDFFDAAIGDRLFRHPGAEHRADSAPKLLEGVVRKVLPGLPAEVRFVFRHQFFPAAGGHSGIFLDPEPIFHGAKPVFEIFLRHVHDDGRIHLHETAIGVVSESFVPRYGGETFDGAVVQAEIENGLHHSRHGAGGTGAHTDEERVFRISEFLFRGAFELGDVVGDLLLQLRRILLAVLVKVIAHFRGDGETGGHGQADLGHLG